MKESNYRDIICFLLFTAFLGVASVYAEGALVRKTNWLPNSQEHIFYKNGVEVGREELDNKGHNLIKNQGQIPDGVYKDNDWHREISYKNGLENGPMKTYGEDGTLSFEHEMKDGKPIGLKVYFPDGKIKAQTVFNEDGTKVEQIYDQNGQLVKVNKYTK